MPAWIREGLEKMEREKQKKLEKEQKKKEEEETRIAKEKAEKEAEEALERENAGEPRIPRKSRFVCDLMRLFTVPDKALFQPRWLSLMHVSRTAMIHSPHSTIHTGILVLLHNTIPIAIHFSDLR